MKEKINIYF